MKRKTIRGIKIWTLCAGICAALIALRYTGNGLGLQDKWFFAVIGLCVLVASGVQLSDLAENVKSIGLRGIEFRDVDSEDDSDGSK